MIIPAGKKVIIRQGGKDVLEGYSPLTLDSEITVSFQSDFDSLLGDTGGKFLTLISGATQALFDKISVTGRFKEAGYQVWTGTKPVSFSISTTLHMKTNALSDVMIPSSKLIKLCLPSEGKATEGEFGLVAPGPSLFAVFDDTKIGQQEAFSVRIGAFYLSNVIIRSVEPSYALETDENGFPIWCTLKIDISSLFTATSDMVDKFNYSIES